MIIKLLSVLAGLLAFYAVMKLVLSATGGNVDYKKLDEEND